MSLAFNNYIYFCLVTTEKPDETISIQIVGQERYNEILYVWNDISPITKTGPQVTLVGLYEPAKQKNSVSCFIFKTMLRRQG